MNYAEQTSPYCVDIFFPDALMCMQNMNEAV